MLIKTDTIQREMAEARLGDPLFDVMASASADDSFLGERNTNVNGLPHRLPKHPFVIRVAAYNKRHMSDIRGYRKVCREKVVLCTTFRKNPDRAFFETQKPGPKREAVLPGRSERRDRAVALRKEHNLSVTEISAILAREGMPTSATAVNRMLREAGLPKLWRRTPEQREEARPERAADADCKELDLSPRRFRTGFGGLFLFAADLARCDLDGMLAQADMPGRGMIPPGHAFRSLLALKLWGIGRPSQVMAETLDEGPALFAGLDVIPKRSSWSDYSPRADPRIGPELMDRWHAAVRSLDVDLGEGLSFDLDFHTIPYHGDDALIEKHYVSKRSRRQRGVLAFVARDAGARFFAYANANVRKQDQNDEILRFAENWRTRTGSLPGELVFDSRLTTYANLARLNALDIAFLTLRRRSPKLLAEILATPAEAWRQITLTNVGRIYRKPRILDQRIARRHYPGELRQITITDLGHEKPTLLITNQMDPPARVLVDRYARRMVIENTIADAIDFFHMDALSAAVPLKVQLDLQITLMASVLYRILAKRLGNGMQNAGPRNLFRKVVNSSATIEIKPEEVVVSLGRRANNPLLIAVGYAEQRQQIPWLANRVLRIRFI